MRKMTGTWKASMLLAASITLMGCEAVWPTTEAPDPVAAPPAPPPQVTTAPSVSTQPAVQTTTSTVRATQPSSGQIAPTTVSTPQIGETFVGRKIDSMQGDLTRLENGVVGIKQRANSITSNSRASADRYHALIAAITARLQQGTTPGNPILVAQWNQAQSALENIAQVTPQVTSLSNDAAEQAAFGQFLLNSVQATYGLSGAVDEDHVRLRSLEDKVHQAVVEVDRTLNELSQDISRQNIYVNGERQNMTTLSLAIKNGELYGSSLATQAFAQTESIARATALSTAPVSGDQPLVIIRFDRPNVQYQQALFTAVSQALSRKPNAVFNLLAVSPAQGNAASVALNSSSSRRHAEDVLRTLTDMGVSSSRVQLLSTTDAVADNEVHVFVR